jgi:hypothetical protein
MPEPWVPERARLFLRELAAQRASGTSPNCNEVADAIGMDEHESSEVMYWLALESLVRESGPDPLPVVEPFSCDPYTMGPLEATARGRGFMDTGELPSDVTRN